MRRSFGSAFQSFGRGRTTSIPMKLEAHMLAMEARGWVGLTMPESICSLIPFRVLSRRVRKMEGTRFDKTARVGGHVADLWDQCSAVTELLALTYDAIFTKLRRSGD